MSAPERPVEKPDASEAVSRSVLSKFQKILRKPDGNDEIVLRHHHLLEGIRSGYPPDIQRCLVQITSEWKVEKVARSPSIVYFPQPFYGVSQTVESALIEIFDLRLVRLCVKQRILWVYKVS